MSPTSYQAAPPRDRPKGYPNQSALSRLGRDGNEAVEPLSLAHHPEALARHALDGVVVALEALGDRTQRIDLKTQRDDALDLRCVAAFEALETEGGILASPERVVSGHREEQELCGADRAKLQRHRERPG